jgi:acetyl-CoA carboxylase biotin carboxyl carrier protein
MTFKEIQDLIKMIDKSTLSEFSFKTETYEIKIKGHQAAGGQMVYAQAPVQTVATAQPVSSAPAATPAPSESKSENKAAEDNSKLIEVKSPMVGTFYRSPGPDKPSFVNVGDTIGKGSTVCIIEAMKLFNEIDSEYAGKIVKIMVEDASPVEYDQVLFLLEP